MTIPVHRWKPGQRCLFRGNVVEVLSVQRQDYLGDDYFTLFLIDPTTGRGDWHLASYATPLSEDPACRDE